MTGIQEAQERWRAQHAKGRNTGIVVLVVIVAVVALLALFAGDNALFILGGLVVVGVVLAVIAFVLGSRRSGLSLTPEWKPEPSPGQTGDDFDDFDDDFDDEPAPAAPAEPAEAPAPVRRVDAQILGADLTKLGQVVSPKLSKSYAMGDLVVQNDSVRWVPSVASVAQGIDRLVTEPAQVTSVERAELWGSWALLRIVRADGSEWCLRIPNSVDLTPAFEEIGLTLQVV